MVKPLIVVATVKDDTSMVEGTWVGVMIHMMMDSGSTVSPRTVLIV